MTDLRKGLSVFDALLAQPRATGFGFRIPIFPQASTRNPDPLTLLNSGRLQPRTSQGSILSPLNAESVANTPAQVSLADSHPAVLPVSGQQSNPAIPQGRTLSLPGVNAPSETQTAESPTDTNDALRQFELQRLEESKRRREVNREIEALKKAKGRKVIVRMEEARVFAIRNNLPAIFKVSPSRRGTGAAPFYRKHHIGAEAVRKHDETIVRESKRFGVDPDLVRAIMYIENADGDRLRLDRAAQFAGLADTLLPMNINPTIWEGVGGVRGEQFENPELNIRAGVALIKAIQDRIEKPTPAKIGSVWQFTGKENVSDNGKKIERAMREQLWITGSPFDGDPAPRGP